MNVLFVGIIAVLINACAPNDSAQAMSFKNNHHADSCLLVPASSSWGPQGEVAVRAEVVADGLEVPWAIAFLPNGDMLVTERPGRIRLIREGALVDTPVAQLLVDPAGEGGLLGLALHPDFQGNRLFYIYLSVDNGGANRNRIERWRLSEDSRSAARESVIIDTIPAARYHNGGRIRFGPDGMLYVGTGDAGEPALSQRVESPAGKILRLSPEGDVPEDNPFAGHAAYIMGIRNTQGFDWREDGVMLVTDHGPSGEMGRRGADEINVASAGSNLGWPDIYLCENAQGMVSPSLTFERALPPGGAAIYTGDAIGAWKGSLMIGTLGSRHLHRVAFKENGPIVESHSIYFQGDPPQGFGRLREVIMGPDGHLYVTTSNCDGRGTCPPENDKILRIVPK